MWENPWFVGIVGGIVSGLLVFLITNLVVNKVSRKEYYSKVKESNREIIGLLIMSVSEGRIPSLQVIKSLLKSLSRSYGIKEGDMNGIKETLEDLVKEIFETKFISNDKKNELSESLIKLIDEHREAGYEASPSGQKGNMNFTYAYALAISVVVLSVMTSILVIINPMTSNANSLDLTDTLILPFAVGAAIAVSFSLASTIRIMKGKARADLPETESRINKVLRKLSK